MSQNEDVKTEIIRLLDSGMTDKQDIYTSIVDQMGVPRPTVRRVARELLAELKKKVDVLEQKLVEITVH